MTRVTTHSLRAQKAAGDKICMLTAYDATFARLLDDSGIDILLVGDSLGMVIQGHDTTLPVTMEDIIYHCRAVVRGTRRAQVVGDMPFMSYQESLEQVVRNAGRLMKEGGCHAVKLEGGAQHAALVARMTATGIPVMGHIGLTPQSVHQFGGFKVQGKGADAVAKLTADARALEDAGAYAIVRPSRRRSSTFARIAAGSRMSSNGNRDAVTSWRSSTAASGRRRPCRAGSSRRRPGTRRP